MVPKARKGQAPARLARIEFRRRFADTLGDPAFAQDMAAWESVEATAYDGYHHSRKAPVTRAAGRGFADPQYQTSVEWLQARDRLRAAEKTQRDAATRARVLVICASPRNDGTCPGEISKTFRLANLAMDEIRRAHIECDFLDLSLITSDYRRHIHPCKGCVSSAMPLCHWPCSCYPNHSLGQTNDWMAEIYERWTAAHGVLIVTPVHWYQVPSVLKLMIDRLVCADGGNPDVTSTHGKNVAEAKALELKGWDYPKHLAGRTYGVVVPTPARVGCTPCRRQSLSRANHQRREAPQVECKRDDPCARREVQQRLRR
ncbi:MAG: NAD(P)H-dependent oxidoreductase [Casimicrobiaceae bacterium]